MFATVNQFLSVFNRFCVIKHHLDGKRFKVCGQIPGAASTARASASRFHITSNGLIRRTPCSDCRASKYQSVLY